MSAVQLSLLALCLAFLAGCGRPMTRVEDGNRRQIFHKGNGAEPQDLDPHTVSGVPEDFIITALLEGLVGEDPKDLHEVPGVAATWDVSTNGTVYTFHLRPDAKWSNGDRVTATDFVESYKRMLTPSLASEYAYMLYPMRNAEDFNNGKLKDFTQVGVKALDPGTLEITLHSPTPFFMAVIRHYSWFPVHLPTIAKFGPVYERGNRWTRPGNFVGNGPFNLSDWKFNYVITTKKSPTYWDARNVRLNEVRFYPIESQDAEERAFRAGQLHSIYELGVSKIEGHQKSGNPCLHIDPYLGNYFYQFNTTRPPLNDKRVRRALAIAIDRESLVQNVTHGGERPAYSFVPPGTAGYQPDGKIPSDLAEARRLLAEAGYPDGKGFPPIDILYNTLERHKIIAEAVQQMWKTRLGIEVRLVNEEWKVYLDSMKQLNYAVARFGWIGDYPDPNSFLDMWLTGGGNNRTGWSSPDYDRLIKQAGATIDHDQRMRLLQQAESILMDEAPIAPIYFYTQPYLLARSVRGWYPTIINHHPFKHIFLEPTPP